MMTGVRSDAHISWDVIGFFIMKMEKIRANDVINKASNHHNSSGMSDHHKNAQSPVNFTTLEQRTKKRDA